jgi:hypothetical protein
MLSLLASNRLLFFRADDLAGFCALAAAPPAIPACASRAPARVSQSAAGWLLTSLTKSSMTSGQAETDADDAEVEAG